MLICTQKVGAPAIQRLPAAAGRDGRYFGQNREEIGNDIPGDGDKPQNQTDPEGSRSGITFRISNANADRHQRVFKPFMLDPTAS